MLNLYKPKQCREITPHKPESHYYFLLIKNKKKVAEKEFLNPSSTTFNK